MKGNGPMILKYKNKKKYEIKVQYNKVYLITQLNFHKL